VLGSARNTAGSNRTHTIVGLKQQRHIEVKTKEEIAAAVNKELGVTSDSVDSNARTLRANRSGLQIATLSLPTTTANLLIA